MATGNRATRVGRVRIVRRGKSFGLCYHDQGRRRRPRVGTDLRQARQFAAQLNGKLDLTPDLNRHPKVMKNIAEE